MQLLILLTETVTNPHFLTKMILHEAVDKLKETSETMGIEDCNLIYRHLPENERCQFSQGDVMGVEFGGRVAECTTTSPFTAKMKLDNLYGAPLQSPKTRAAAMGALNAVSAFLMLTRKSGQCNSVFAEDCLSELIAYCKNKKVYIIGSDIPEISEKTDKMDDAELILVNGESFLIETGLEEIEHARKISKEIRLIGPNCHGLAALLHIPIWCPYSR